jgi:hypothetical protein
MVRLPSFCNESAFLAIAKFDTYPSIISVSRITAASSESLSPRCDLSLNGHGSVRVQRQLVHLLDVGTADDRQTVINYHNLD